MSQSEVTENGLNDGNEIAVSGSGMQDILGHADAETTLQIYADATKELKRVELINFEDYFNALKEAQEG